MKTLVQAVIEHSEITPTKPALIFKGTLLSYAELADGVKQFASILQNDYSVSSHDRIMISAVSKPDYVIAFLAVQFLGATSVPVDKTAKEDSIADLYSYVEPKLFITDVKLKSEKCTGIKTIPLKKQFEKSILKYSDDSDCSKYQLLNYKIPASTDIAEILFTTGTTGAPKGVMLSFENIEAISQNNQAGVGMQSDDVILDPLPLQHSLGLRVLRSALYLGATVVLQSGFVFISDLEKNLSDNKCTAMVCVPSNLETLFRQLGQEKFSSLFGKLRYIEAGAGNINLGFRQHLIECLPDTTVYNSYGSTETGGTIYWSSKFSDKIDALGKPVDGIEIKLLGSEVPARLALHGKMQMTGYYKNPEVTKNALVAGWLVTNDLCYFDDDGFVYMVGRADDIINVGGEKVAPLEIENVVSTFEGINECACIGVEDKEGTDGKVPVLFVVPQSPNFDKKALSKYLSTKLETYKIPREYIIVDELPRNKMKKLDRKTLYNWYSEREDNQAIQSEISNDVIKAICARRSIRDFTEKPINRSILETIVKCGIYAPNGHNMQTWHFTIITDSLKIGELKNLAKNAAKKYGSSFYGFNNPIAVILVSEDKRSPYALQNGSAAAQNIMLAAHSFGIGSVWVNALYSTCEEIELREFLSSLGVPQSHLIVSTICLGYPANEGKSCMKKQNLISWNE